LRVVAWEGGTSTKYRGAAPGAKKERPNNPFLSPPPSFVLTDAKRETIPIEDGDMPMPWLEACLPDLSPDLPSDLSPYSDLPPDIPPHPAEKDCVS